MQRRNANKLVRLNVFLSCVLSSTQEMNTTISEQKCPPTGDKWNYVFLMPLPVLSGLINLFVFVAATLHRKKLLQHSYVYTSVASTLISNILFLSLHLWDEVEGFKMSDIGRGPKSDPSPTMEVSGIISRLKLDCMILNINGC